MSCAAPWDVHRGDALSSKRGQDCAVPKAAQFRPRPLDRSTVKPNAPHNCAMEPSRAPAVVSAEFGSQAMSNLCRVALAPGEPLCGSFPMNVRRSSRILQKIKDPQM